MTTPLMERELKAVKSYTVYDPDPEWIDPNSSEGKRKLLLTKHLAWQHETADNGEQRSLLTVADLGPTKPTYGIGVPKLLIELLRMVVNHAVYSLYELHHLKLQDAYKYSFPETEIYVHPLPESSVNKDPRVNQGLVPIHSLERAIPGVPQFFELWSKAFHGFMQCHDLKFVTSDETPCVFVSRENKSDDDPAKLVVVLDGDEIFVAAQDPQVYDRFVSTVCTLRSFNARDMGRPRVFAGVDFTYFDGGVRLSSTTRINQFIDKSNIDVTVGLKLSSPLPKDLNLLGFADRWKLIEHMSPDDIAEGKRWMEERIQYLHDIAELGSHGISDAVVELGLFINYPHIVIKRLVQRALLYVAQHPQSYVEFSRENLKPASINCTIKTHTDFDNRLVSYTISSTTLLSGRHRPFQPFDHSTIDVQVGVLYNAIDEIFRIQKLWRFIAFGSDADRLLNKDVAVVVDDKALYDCFQLNDYHRVSSWEMENFDTVYYMLTLKRWSFLLR